MNSKYVACKSTATGRWQRCVSVPGPYGSALLVSIPRGGRARLRTADSEGTQRLTVRAWYGRIVMRLTLPIIEQGEQGC